jgi:hypothetical protein
MAQESKIGSTGRALACAALRRFGATAAVVLSCAAAHKQPAGSAPARYIDCPSSDLVDPVTLYVAPNGVDTNGGTIDAPLATLAGAQSRINQLDPAPLDADYLVNVRGGEYRGQTVVWTTTSPEYRVHIVAYAGETPVFDGTSAQSGAVQPILFDLVGGHGSPTNLTIRGLTISHYVQRGILLYGGKNGAGNSCNVIAENRFIYIGSKYGKCCTSRDATGACVDDPAIPAAFLDTPECSRFVRGDRCDCTGFGAVTAIASSKNVFRHNSFISTTNRPGAWADLIHAFYLAHGSTDNLIEDNDIHYCSGNPFKFRDGSNRNTIRGNYVEFAGAKGFFSSRKRGAEALSIGNILSGNTTVSGYPPRSTIPLTEGDCATGGGQPCFEVETTPKPR